MEKRTSFIWITTLSAVFSLRIILPVKVSVVSSMLEEKAALKRILWRFSSEPIAVLSFIMRDSQRLS